MDAVAAEGLAATKELYGVLRKAGKGKAVVDHREMMKLCKTANAAIAKQRGHIREARARSRVERDILQMEVRADLVDREANAARVMEKQRFLFERSHARQGIGIAHDNASASVAFVEAALVGLDARLPLAHAGTTRLEAAQT